MATKSFDCVEMKRQIQQKLMDEYGERKAEFSSYFDFLEAKGNESPLTKRMQEKLSKSNRAAS